MRSLLPALLTVGLWGCSTEATIDLPETRRLVVELVGEGEAWVPIGYRDLRTHTPCHPTELEVEGEGPSLRCVPAHSLGFDRSLFERESCGELPADRIYAGSLALSSEFETKREALVLVYGADSTGGIPALVGPAEAEFTIVPVPGGVGYRCSPGAFDGFRLSIHPIVERIPPSRFPRIERRITALDVPLGLEVTEEVLGDDEVRIPLWAHYQGSPCTFAINLSNRPRCVPYTWNAPEIQATDPSQLPALQLGAGRRYVALSPPEFYVGLILFDWVTESFCSPIALAEGSRCLPNPTPLDPVHSGAFTPYHRSPDCRDEPISTALLPAVPYQSSPTQITTWGDGQAVAVWSVDLWSGPAYKLNGTRCEPASLDSLEAHWLLAVGEPVSLETFPILDSVEL